MPGEVVNLQIPASPAQKFRLKLSVEDRLRGLIREDSFVTVETEGLVGDKFLPSSILVAIVRPKPRRTALSPAKSPST